MTLSAACGPSLRSRPGPVQAFRSTQVCSQGPFVVDLPASGARWGEEIVVKAWSRRVIQGRYDVTVGGQVVASGHFGKRYYRYGPEAQQQSATRSSVSRWRMHTAKGPDNRRCVAAPGAQPGQKGGPAASGGTSGGTNGGTNGRGSVARPTPAPRTARAAPPRKVITFQPLTQAQYKSHLKDERSYLRYDLIKMSLGKVEVSNYPYCRPSRRSGILKSTRIRIRLWSETPNDMEGAWFEVQQNRYKPSVSEAEFIAHLDKRQAACLKKTQRKARKSRRRLAKQVAKLQAKLRANGGARRQSARCRYNVVPFDGKVTYFYRPTKRMICGCREKIHSTRCWGAGGYSGYLARLRKNLGRRSCQIRLEIKLKGRVTYQAFVKKPCRCAHDLKDRSCWGAGGYLAYTHTHQAQSQRRRRLRAEKIKRARALRKLARQPPPLPRAEKRPPKPSRNAKWVGGYWVRIKGGPSAGHWGWIAGWWRVPKADVKQGLTTRSRRRPPPLRKELRRPTRPSTQAVWAPGYWHWSGRGFVWVHGAWRIPPRAQLRWRPARWIRRGPFRILIPGGWIR